MVIYLLRYELRQYHIAKGWKGVRLLSKLEFWVEAFSRKFNFRLYLECEELPLVLPWPFLFDASSEWIYPISQVKPPFLRVLGTNSLLKFSWTWEHDDMIDVHVLSRID